jgi:hypothetical protein
MARPRRTGRRVRAAQLAVGPPESGVCNAAVKSFEEATGIAKGPAEKQCRASRSLRGLSGRRTPATSPSLFGTTVVSCQRPAKHATTVYDPLLTRYLILNGAHRRSGQGVRFVAGVCPDERASRRFETTQPNTMNDALCVRLSHRLSPELERGGCHRPISLKPDKSYYRDSVSEVKSPIFKMRERAQPRGTRLFGRFR